MKNFRFKTIRKETLHCLFKDNRDYDLKNKWIVKLYYYILPLILSIILVLFQFFLNKDSITYFITGISIFAGLFFNLLIVVSDKMIKRKVLLKSNYDTTKEYAEQYKLMSERLIAAISYEILLSVFLIGIMFLSQIDYEVFAEIITKENLSTINLVSDYIFNFLSYFFGFQFVVILLLVLSKTYEILMHEMNVQEYQENNLEK